MGGLRRGLTLALLSLLIPILTSYGSNELSSDYENVFNRLKSLGFREYGETFWIKGDGSSILVAPFYKGSSRALLIYVQWDDGYSEAYSYMIYGDKILLDSFSRAGKIKLSNELKRFFSVCSIGLEPLEASCQDCISNGCRPCCSSQISCPPSRYADCKFICSSWDNKCLYRCGLSLVGCAEACGSCIAAPNPLTCGICLGCVLGSPLLGEECAKCCKSSRCACRCLRYH